MPHPKRPEPATLQALVGTTFGAWTVQEWLGLLPWKGGPRRYNIFRCRCACGRVRPFRLGDINARRSSMCHACANGARLTRHGEAGRIRRPRPRGDGARHTTRRRRYAAYLSMLRNARHRGIAVDPRWEGPDGYRSCVADLSIPAGVPVGIRRRDKAGPYAPANCSVVKLQPPRLYYYEGSWWTVGELAFSHDIHPATLAGRLRNGASVPNAVRCPVAHKYSRYKDSHAT